LFQRSNDDNQVEKSCTTCQQIFKRGDMT
jgi:hypothetical protein